MLLEELFLLPLPPLECACRGVEGWLFWPGSRRLLMRPRVDWKPELLLLRRPRTRWGVPRVLLSASVSRSELYEYSWPAPGGRPTMMAVLGSGAFLAMSGEAAASS
jgi:hypothetical protein